MVSFNFAVTQSAVATTRSINRNNCHRNCVDKNRAENVENPMLDLLHYSIALNLGAQSGNYPLLTKSCENNNSENSVDFSAISTACVV